MNRLLFLLLVALASCVKQPHFKIDLGDLSDPKVQERVAIRERDRARIIEDSTQLGKIVSRLQPIAQIFNEAMPKVKQDRANECAIQVALFQLALLHMHIELTLAATNGDQLAKRVQQAAYSKDDAEIVGKFRELETTISEASTNADDTREKLKEVFQCVGIRIRIMNPEDMHDTLFDTGGTEQLPFNHYFLQ